MQEVTLVSCFGVESMKIPTFLVSVLRLLFTFLDNVTGQQLFVQKNDTNQENHEMLLHRLNDHSNYATSSFLPSQNIHSTPHTGP